MKITLLNYALPEPDPHGAGTRWWHKSGSRWPASVRDRRNDGSEYFPWPFLLAYAHSMLEEDGHDVTSIDACIEKSSLEEVVHRVRTSDPDWLVFETSEQTEHTDPSVLAALEGMAPVVLIGPNVTEEHSELLDWPGCDAVVPGEFLAGLRDYFRDPVAGVAPRRDVTAAEMDDLPFAYRDPALFSKYNARFKTTPPGVQGQFVSMWGCQYRCKFCIWIHAYWPRTSQFKKQFSPARVEAELGHMIRHIPGITSLYDDADNHHLRGDQAYEFAEMMGRIGLPWAILTRADTYMTRSGAIDAAVWKAYRDNGCYAVKIGVEGTQEAMDASNKRLSEEVVREWVPFMQDLGVSVYCSFMLGVPNTSTDADRDTLALIEDLASYRPETFEYFISYCDVTRVTPFIHDVELRDRLHDGQLRIEELLSAGVLAQPLGMLEPNNLAPVDAE